MRDCQYLDDDKDKDGHEIVGSRNAPLRGGRSQRQQVHDRRGASDDTSHFVARRLVGADRYQLCLSRRPGAFVAVDFRYAKILVARSDHTAQFGDVFV